MKHFRTDCCMKERVIPQDVLRYVKGTGMLKLSLKPGEFIDIGENIRIIFSGGSSNNIHLLIDAPKELNVKRNKAIRKDDGNSDGYYAERKISAKAQQQIMEILKKERENASSQ